MEIQWKLTLISYLTNKRYFTAYEATTDGANMVGAIISSILGI